MAFDIEDDYSTPSLEELREAAPRTTDSANADAMAVIHGRGYLFVIEWDAWIAWNGTHWQREGARARVLNACLLTAREAHYRTLGRIRSLEEEFRQSLIKGQKDEAVEVRLKNEQRLLKWHEQSQNMSRLEAGALAVILEKLNALIVFYHEHIRKEDNLFFPASTGYLTNVEQDAILLEFWESDRKMIHEKYRSVVESWESVTE